MSALWGAIDVVYNWIGWLSQPSDLRWFSKGYGDLDKHFRLADELLREWSSDGLEEWLQQKAVEIQWCPNYSNHGCFSSACSGSGSGSSSGLGSPSSVEVDLHNVWIDEAVWRSPLAEYLPDGPTQNARFLFVRADPAGNLPPARCIFVHMAHTGDESYESRLQNLALPLLEHGIASVIPMPSFYGLRRPLTGQKEYYIETVADFLIQDSAVIIENTRLLRWMARGFTAREGEHHNCPLGVSGFSWGGAMAPCVALMSRLRVACVPYAGSVSPLVMSTGIIRWQVDWSALREEKQQSHQEAVAEIERLFTHFTLTQLLEIAPEPKATIGALVQLSPYSDYYISQQDGQQLYDTLSKAVVPGGLVDFQWISGGHATAYMSQTSTCMPAFLTAVESLLHKK